VRVLRPGVVNKHTVVSLKRRQLVAWSMPPASIICANCRPMTPHYYQSSPGHFCTSQTGSGDVYNSTGQIVDFPWTTQIAVMHKNLSPRIWARTYEGTRQTSIIVEKSPAWPATPPSTKAVGSCTAHPYFPLTISVKIISAESIDFISQYLYFETYHTFNSAAPLQSKD
jgi:hypothetical protein